ncbi:TatD DNase family protein [Cnuella takakiae]|uniref:TatD DNase family protein n=1 Tax=Cnuella takakiae TaxID=1302690 RepID=A0A1M5IYU2_9BACT|nr:TatD family hydrolase [Cnuella takakiae]OLY91409.1 hydrolase TatD [Cnuella takakiae]SHG33476.1 TatD DNase family protein [Cnuella takakiae]
MNPIIDTHTHIYLPELNESLENLVGRAREAGVTQMLLPAIDSETHQQLLQVADTYGYLPMMGLHPCSVKANFEAELSIIKNYLAQRSFIAVGEIGLDFYWDRTFEKEQYEAFHQQIALALEYNLPISIHSRNATPEAIDVVRQYPGLRGVFHCFSGSVEEAEAALATGFYLGIGGVVTFKNGGLDKVINAVGLDKVVLETDAPYLAPVPFRGKRNEPSYLTHVVAKLAELTGLPEATVAARTTENAQHLFNIKG